MIKLTDRARSQLRAASAFGGDHIDGMVNAVQRENPGAFWRENELDQRNFYDEPVSCGFILPHHSCVQRYKSKGLK